jgi:hypothetical protein
MSIAEFAALFAKREKDHRTTPHANVRYALYVEEKKEKRENE